jgi:hypothetical protein
VGTNIYGFWISSIAGNYQGTVSVPLVDPGGNSVGPATVPVVLSITSGTNNSVAAILYCQSCQNASGGMGVEISYSGTVVGGAFHGTNSTYPGWGLDVIPLEALATGKLLGVQVTIKGLGNMFYGIPVPLNSNPTDSVGLALGDLTILSGPLPTCVCMAE